MSETGPASQRQILDRALRRLLQAGAWENPVPSIIAMIAEQTPLRLQQEGPLWRVEGQVAAEDRPEVERLCDGLAFFSRMREDLEERSHLDPGLAPQEGQRRLQEVIDSVSEVIVSLDLRHNIISWNRAAQELFSYTAQEVVGRPFFDVLPQLFSRVDLNQLAVHSQHRMQEREIQWRKGAWVGVKILPVRNEMAQERGLVLVLRDSTRAREQRALLEQSAWTDPLTGLSNRSYLLAQLQSRLLHLMRVPKRIFAVAFIDVDRFKRVNDTLGHRVGAQMLKAVGRRLQEISNKEDQIARFGGDEFVMMIEGCLTPADAGETAERIRRAFQEPLYLEDGTELHTSVTVGIALATPADEAEELLRAADIAVLNARSRGTDQVQVFTERMRSQMQEEADMSDALRRDVDRHINSAIRSDSNPFWVAYQPIVRLNDDRVDGFEALMRWSWNQKPISPATFIRLTEESGLIVPLGRWVLEQSCRQIRQWLDLLGQSGPRFVNVNVSARQLTAHYVQDVERVLRECRLEPEHLCLEITESCFVDDDDVIQHVIKAIEKLGVRLVMDDFGTGYSSFGYLFRLPFSSLKLDRSFTQRITRSDRDERIVRSIVHLAREIGMSVTAEGVEEAEEYRRLKEMDCPRVQGYYCSKPLTPADATAWLQGGGRVNVQR